MLDPKLEAGACLGHERRLTRRADIFIVNRSPGDKPAVIDVSVTPALLKIKYFVWSERVADRRENTYLLRTGLEVYTYLLRAGVEMYTYLLRTGLELYTYLLRAGLEVYTYLLRTGLEVYTYLLRVGLEVYTYLLRAGLEVYPTRGGDI